MLISEILDRVGQKINAKSDADIGRALGIQKNPSQYVKNWRVRGTIPWSELCTFAINEKISLDLLFTGEDKQADNCEVKCSEKIAELCKKVKKVVESNTHWGASLEANIHSFHAGVETDKEIVEIKKSIPALLLGSGRKRRGVRAKKTQK